MSQTVKHLCLVLVFLALPAVQGYAKSGSTLKKVEILEKIEEAKGLLKTQEVALVNEVVGTRRVKKAPRVYEEIPVTKVVGRQMALAILTEDGEIKIARGIKRDKGIDSLSAGFNLFVRRDNGINSDIAVIEPAGGKVIAVKYPVTNENNRFGSGEAIIQAVYTPFSNDLKSDALVEQGLRLEMALIERAYKYLESRAVMSQAFPGRRMAEVIPKDVVRNLLINEHIDPSFFSSQAQAKQLIEQVLVIIATNKEKAYAYSISSAGARGLVQMIPSTYALLVRKYPAAGLNYDFNFGMVDTLNAIVAQVLLCDADWQSINSSREVSKDQIGPYLAAAYNGGVGRVIDILRDNEVGWMENPEAGKKPTKVVVRSVPVSVPRTIYVKQKGKRVKKVVYRTVYVKRSFTLAIFRAETNKYILQYHWINSAFKDGLVGAGR
ncbi:MAG: hypothetical protein AB1757_19475 [Acidobacteriota bacterium]